MEQALLITIMFIITGIIDVYVYYPIIKDLIRYPKETAKNTNLTAWTWWFVSALISITYYVMVVKDLWTIIMAISHLIGCAIISILIIRYRLKFDIPIFKKI